MQKLARADKRWPFLVESVGVGRRDWKRREMLLLKVLAGSLASFRFVMIYVCAAEIGLLFGLVQSDWEPHCQFRVAQNVGTQNRRIRRNAVLSVSSTCTPMPFTAGFTVMRCAQYLRKSNRNYTVSFVGSRSCAIDPELRFTGVRHVL